MGLEVNGKREYHNYSFAMKIQATFQYVKGQYFEFNGDDDVWVFIDNKLVVDIGGQHKKVKKSVDLDKLGLIEDSTYNFHIFYAERKREASNFMMRTSIDLHVESSMFLTDISDDPDLIKKEVWQKIRERVLACDFSSEPEKESTELGPSNFVLFGRSLDSKGIPLNVHLQSERIVTRSLPRRLAPTLKRRMGATICNGRWRSQSGKSIENGRRYRHRRIRV